MTIEHPLFQRMNHEHQQVQSALATLDSLTQRGELLDLAQHLWQRVIVEHHHREETLLFKKVYQKPKISQGGPMCTLYFGLHIMKGSGDIEKIIKKPLSIEPHQQEIIQAQSPLMIPLEEHRAGKDLLAHLLRYHEQLDVKTIKEYLNLFKSNLLKHIVKEENCLFHLCANLLAPEEADEIYRVWK